MNQFIDDKEKPTAEGWSYLEKIVTSPDGQVYAFTDKAEPFLIAGAMARLSRSSDDVRIIILKEFAGASPAKLTQLFYRVITEYGDDSVQQLMPIRFVVKNISNVMTKLLEWSRYASYLEQSSRYIYFDVEDPATGRYRFHVPEYLPASLKQDYLATMDKIFSIYSRLVKSLTEYIRKMHPAESDDPKTMAAWAKSTKASACDAIRNLLPAATTSTVGVVASAQAVEQMIWRLRSLALPEAQELADKILDEVKKVAEPFFGRTNLPDKGLKRTHYRASTDNEMRRMVKLYLPELDDPDREHLNLVSLDDYWPIDERSLIAKMLFPYGSVSKGRIRSSLENLPEEVLGKIFQAYIGDRDNRRDKPGRAIEKLHYDWEVVCDYGAFRDLQRHRIVDCLQWQKLLPYYGFTIPGIVERAGLATEYQEAYSLAEKLYAKLKASGFDEEAQYAVLFGHKMRWETITNAREAFHLHELRTGKDGHVGYRSVAQEMHRHVARVHPKIAAAMKYVDLSQSADVVRLNSEKRSQEKLAALSS